MISTSSPLPNSSRSRSRNYLYARTTHSSPPVLLLTLIQDDAKHIEREHRELNAQLPELIIGLVTQEVTSVSPERSNRSSNRIILRVGVLVHVSCICDLALGRTFGRVDLAMRQAIEFGQVQPVG